MTVISCISLYGACGERVAPCVELPDSAVLRIPYLIQQQRLVTEKLLSAPKKGIYLLAADVRNPRVAGTGGGVPERRILLQEAERNGSSGCKPH